MATDEGVAAVAAIHSQLTTPFPAGNHDMASVITDSPGSANFTYFDKFDSRLLWYEDHIVGGFLVIVGVMSLLGNGCTMVMFCRKLKHLTAAEVLLLNMAVMHLCLAIFSYPAPTVSSFAHRWLFGNFGCQLYGFVCYTLGVATIVSMVALAVVRYLKTCTHTYSRTLSAQHMKVVLLAVYLYSLFWALLPIFCMTKGYEVEPFGLSCTLHWTSNEKAAQVYILLSVVFVVVVPFVMMFWCYLRILIMVTRNRRKVIVSKRSSNSQGRMELQLSVVSALVCLGYLVAWLPYTVVSVLYALQRRESPVYATLAPVLLAKSSCAYNPIIYIFVNARYRQQMMGILCEAFQPIICCCTTSQQSDAAGQTADTSQDMKSSRTFAMAQDSSLMFREEMLPLTAIGRAATRCLPSTEDTMMTSPGVTSCGQLPGHTPSPQHPSEGATSPPPSGQSLGATSPRGDEQPAQTTLNSSTVFHPLYRFSGSEGESGPSCRGSRQQSVEGTKEGRGSVSDGHSAPRDEMVEDGREALSTVSSPTDSGDCTVSIPAQRGGEGRKGSLKTRANEKQPGEQRTHLQAEVCLGIPQQSSAVTSTSSMSMCPESPAPASQCLAVDPVASPSNENPAGDATFHLPHSKAVYL